MQNVELVNLQNPRISGALSFCSRSGMLGPTKENLAKNSWNFDIADKACLLVTNSSALPTLRIFFKDLKLNTGYKLPQLCLYPPQLGFPLVPLNQVFNRSGRKNLVDYSVEIPIPHILVGLTRKGDKLPHNYSVFYSTWIDPRINNPFDNKYVFSRKNIGKYSGFLTDLKSISEVDSVFPDSLFIRFTDENRYPQELQEIMAGVGGYEGEELTFEEFSRYLCVWLLMYPQKYIKIRGVNKIPTGTEGYTLYVPHYSSDIFFGKGQVLEKYYGKINGPIRLGPGKKPSLKPLDKDVTLSWGKRDNFSMQLAHSLYPEITKEMISTMASIRSAIEYYKGTRVQNSHYPFKLIHLNSKDCYTNIVDTGIKTLSYTLACRRYLDEMSLKTTVEGSSCPKCGEDLVLPLNLTRNLKSFDRIVCIECGYRYLINIINAGLSSKWLSIPDYNLDEILL